MLKLTGVASVQNFSEKAPPRCVCVVCFLFILVINFLRGSEAYDLREVKGDHSETKADLKVQLTRK